MKRKLGIFVGLILVLTGLILNFTKSNISAKEIDSINIFNNSISDIVNEKIEEYKEEEPIYVKSGEAGCYISAFDIKSTKDGTAKFDTDDEVGNDSNDSNGRVRTFDYINYNLEYVTAIEDTTQTVDTAYVDIEFTLEKDPSEAVLNPDTFKWCENMVTTYYYEDGTSSTTWNQSKVVRKQVLTGRRKITNNAEINAIPGVGTLSFGVYVKGAKNGDTIKPKFKCWIEGSDIKQECESDEILITAEPRYNIKLAPGGGIEYYEALSYVDLNSNKYSRKKVLDEEIYGRFNGLTARVQLLNTSADKGLKGVELPQGNIEFDIRLQSICNNVDVTNDIDYTPVLWDYKNNDNNSNTIGALGRKMTIYGSYYSQSAQNASYAAVDNRFNRNQYYVWDAGNYTLTQTDSNTYHVVLKDYSFDLDQFYFPYTFINSSNISRNRADNEGDFSAIRFMFLQRVPENISQTSSLTFKAFVENPQFTSISNAKCNTEMNTSDNSYGRGITVYPKGNYTQMISLYPVPQIASVWGSKDGQMMTSQSTYYRGYQRLSDERGLWAGNLLITFDDDSIELTGRNSTYNSGYAVKFGNSKYLYAAKPDKTGWTSEEEMKNAREENLIYFTSLEQLKAEGYVNVGILYERRNCEIYFEAAYDTYFKIKADAEPSHVAMFKVSSRAWTNEKDTNMMSWTSVPYNGSDHIFGLGSSDPKWKKGTYIEGYTTPTYDINGNYTNPTYSDGKIVNNGIGGYNEGTSVLVLGDKATVSINPINKKVSYDMDLNERVVTYEVVPRLTGNVTSNTDNVYVTVDIPKDLHYNLGSASLNPLSVVENADGSTTIKWTIPNQKIGSAITPITFDATIGKAGTKEDVVNSQQIMVKARISSDYDQRKQLAVFGNYYENTINIIKLATSSISKSVERELVEEGEEFVWTLNYGNTSEISVEKVRMYDVLPYNGDGRGTSFNGSYKLTEVTLDFKDAPKTFENVKNDTKVLYTTDKSVRTQDKSEDILYNGVSAGWNNLGTKSINGTKVTFNNINVNDITALYLDFGGDVQGNEFVYIKLKAVPVNGSSKQQPKDKYVNSFYQYATNQVAIVCSNIAKVEVVERNLSGIAWLDLNKNGIQDEEEEKISEKEVKLYRTTKSAFDTVGATVSVGSLNVFKSYDIFGNEVAPVTTDANGAYRFDHLEQGEYIVTMTGIDKFKITVKDTGNNDTIDNDAEVLKEENKKLMIAGIKNIVLPSIDDMTSSEYSSQNNDFGYYYNTYIDILKTDDKGNAIAGATLQIVDGNGKVIDEWVTTTSAKRFEGILNGGQSYTLKEVKAASGYGVVDDVPFTANQDGTVMTITMKDPKTLVEISKLNLKGDLIAGAKLQILDESKNVVVDNLVSSTEALIIEGKLNSEQRYILHEVEAPKGYILASDISFTVARDGKAQVVMADDYAKGKLKIVKKDSNNKPLSGVTFEITDKDGNKVDEITTGSDGVAITKDLITLLSPYKYQEKVVPENIVKDEKLYDFTLESNGQVIEKDITNKIKTGSIKITKKISATDNTEEALLKGARFSATRKDDATKVYYSDEKSDGIYEIVGLQYGEYVVEEVTIPSNTLKCENYEVFVNEDGKIYEKTIVDTSKKMQITIYKEDTETVNTPQGDATLDGAEYTIYSDEACTKEIEKLVISKNEDGTHSATSKKYRVGTYYVKETKAPTGYMIDSTVYKVEQNPQDQTEELSLHEVISKDKVIKNNIEIIKYIEETDSTVKEELSGAIFKAVLDKDNSKVYYSTTTNENGYAKFEDLPYGSYTITESTVPNKAFNAEFYIGASSDRVKEIKVNILEDKTQKLSYKLDDITDVSKKMQITIYKEDIETGIVAQGDATIDGAEYGVYSDEACTKEIEKLVIAENENGTHSATSKKYRVGTYYVKETKAPTGYMIDETVYKVEQNPETQTEELSMHQVVSKESIKKGNIEILKKLKASDYDAEELLSGAKFNATLKSDTTKVYESNLSGNDGICKIENLPYGSYIVEEIVVPNEALKCSNYEVFVDENGKIYYKDIVDPRKTMNIEINKKLLEQTINKTDAKVEGACFTVYTDENCNTPYIDKNGQVVVIGPTNASGKAISKDMKVATYYLKETTFPEGINKDAIVPGENVSFKDKIYEVEASNTNQSEETKTYSFNAINIPNLGDIQVIKYDDIVGSSNERPSKGAILRLTLKSNPEVMYDAKIDENGYAKFENSDLKELGYEYTIPYGEYEITEIKASDLGEHTYYYINPETVIIERNEQKEYRIFTDKPVEMYLKIVKKDTDTNKIISLSGAKFKVWNMATKSWVSQMTFPSGEYIDEFVTNEEGYLILPQKLTAGEYIVYEIESPNGYYLETEYRLPQDASKIGEKSSGGKYVFIDKQAVGVDDNLPITDKDLIYTINMSDRPLKGKIEIHKVGQVLTDVITTTTKYGEKYEPKFSIGALKGVKYNIVAAEDIKSTDKTTTYVSQGTVVDTVVTNENGIANTKELYLGKYNIVEVDTPKGYIAEASKEIELKNSNSSTRVEVTEQELENRKQNVNLEFTKEFEKLEYVNQDNAEFKAIFGIYTKGDIKNNKGEIVINSNSLVDIIETDSLGKVKNTIDLPEGKYYVKEFEVSSPYYISTSNYDFEVVYDNSNKDLNYTINDGAILNKIEYANIALVKVSSSIGEEELVVRGTEINKTNLDENVNNLLKELNNKTYIEIAKYLKDNNVRTIIGAEYTLYLNSECTKPLLKINENGTIEDAKLIVGEDGIAMLSKVPLGIYYIKETKSPQQMEMSNDVLKVELTIDNKDELVCKVVSDDYVVEALIDKKDIFTGEAVPNCIFEITDESGEVILRSITDEKGKAGIPAKLFENGRKYYYEEIDAPEMYEINTQKQEFVVNFDEETYEWITQKVTFENERKSKELKILKVDDKTGKPLSGCVFSIALLDENGNIKTREDGTPIYLVENAVTNENGEYLIEKAYYGTYKFTEVKAPEGYELNEKDMEGYVFTIDKNSSDRIDFIVTNTGDVAVITISVVAIISIIGIVYVMIKNKKQQVK